VLNRDVVLAVEELGLEHTLVIGLALLRHLPPFLHSRSLSATSPTGRFLNLLSSYYKSEATIKACQAAHSTMTLTYVRMREPLPHHLLQVLHLLGSLGDVGEPDGERVQRSPHVRDVGLVEVALQADAVLDVLAGDGLDLLELGEVLGRQRGAGSPGCSMVLNSFMKRTWPHP
jgi:hypothetical protein